MGTDQDQRTAAAYQVAGQLVRAQSSASEAGLRDHLEKVSAEDIIVVKGIYDSAEKVLNSLSIPYARIKPGKLHSCVHPLLVIINCPGELKGGDVEWLQEFVPAGGCVLTTDWAITHTVAKAWPGYISHKGGETDEEVVKITHVADHPYTTGLRVSERSFRWWVDEYSWPIRIKNTDAVEILMSSRKLGKRYDYPAIAVRITIGKGEVVHMISHSYLQEASETTPDDDEVAAALQAEALRIGYSSPSEIAKISSNDLHMTYSSARFLANVVAVRKQDVTAAASASRIKSSVGRSHTAGDHAPLRGSLTSPDG